MVQIWTIIQSKTLKLNVTGELSNFETRLYSPSRILRGRVTEFAFGKIAGKIAVILQLFFS